MGHLFLVTCNLPVISSYLNKRGLVLAFLISFMTRGLEKGEMVLRKVLQFVCYCGLKFIVCKNLIIRICDRNSHILTSSATILMVRIMTG